MIYAQSLERLLRVRNDNRASTLSARMKIIPVFYCLLYAAWIEGTPINVEGFEGGEVSFQCSYRFAWKNDKYFCKDMCEKSEDVLATVKSGAGEESGRLTLVDSGNRVFTVNMVQLQLADSGRYWCAVDRPGLDTFTAVILTVREVIVNETTAVPDTSPTSTYQHISNSTNPTSGMDTSHPESQSPGTVLYATVGVVAVLIFLALATRFRKRREISKSPAKVCSNSTTVVSAVDELMNEFDDDDVEEVQSMKKSSERNSCAQHPKQDPPKSASTEAECSGTFHIYENTRCFRGPAVSRQSAANVQNYHNTTSGIYIRPLPFLLSERTGDGCVGEYSAASAGHFGLGKIYQEQSEFVSEM